MSLDDCLPTAHVPLVTKGFHVPTVFWIIVEPGSYVRRPSAPIPVIGYGWNLNGFESVWKKGNTIFVVVFLQFPFKVDSVSSVARYNNK